MSFPKLAYAAYAADVIADLLSYESAISRQPTSFWNPLANDSEAMKLAADLLISVTQCKDYVSAYSPSVCECRVHLKVGVLTKSRAEATRMAIVECAATMGEQKYAAAVAKVAKEKKELEAAIAFRDIALKGSTTVEIPAKAPHTPFIEWQILTVHGTYVTVQSDKDPTEVDGLLTFYRGDNLVAKFRNYDHIERQN